MAFNFNLLDYVAKNPRTEIWVLLMSNLNLIIEYFQILRFS